MREKVIVGKEKKNYIGRKDYMEVRGFEPRTFRMQSGRSTTELHPQLAQCLTI